MRDTFFGFEGINDLLISRDDIESAENAIKMRISAFSSVKDLLEEAREVREIEWTPNDTGASKVEQEVLAIIEDIDQLKDGWLENALFNTTDHKEQEKLVLDLISALDKIPTVAIIDFLSLLISEYITEPVAGDIVSQVLAHYTNYSSSFFVQLIAPLNACLNGMIDVCLLQGPQSCFQYFFFQATAISESWVEVMRPYMLMSRLKGLGNYRASSVLYNLWTYYISNCLKIMKEEACFNIWTNLGTVLPIDQSYELNMMFQEGLSVLRRLSSFSQSGANLAFHFTDVSGSKFSFGETSFFSNDITTYWVELKDLTFKDNSIQLNFVDCRPFEFALPEGEKGPQIYLVLSSFAFVGLYKRWCGCFCHNLPVSFGELTLKNEGVFHDDHFCSWNNIELKYVTRVAVPNFEILTRELSS